MAKGQGGADGKSATRKKSGSTDMKSYDPKTSTVSSGGSMNAASMYSPKGPNGPKAPSQGSK